METPDARSVESVAPPSAPSTAVATIATGVSVDGDGGGADAGGVSTATTTLTTTTSGKWAERRVVDPFKENKAPTTSEDAAALEGPRNIALGKRPRPVARTVIVAPSSFKMPRVHQVAPSPSSAPTSASHLEPPEDVDCPLRLLEASLSGATEGDASDGLPRNVLIVNDFQRLGQLDFGTVPVGQRRSQQLTLRNPSAIGAARVKYDGYVLTSATREPAPPTVGGSRFTCDLHVCAVAAAKSVVLRVTFEPREQDLHLVVEGTLRFTVNDRFRLQCRVRGSVVAREGLRARLSSRGHDVEGSVVNPATGESALRGSTGAQGNKRREPLAVMMSPTRAPKTKKPRVSTTPSKSKPDQSPEMVTHRAPQSSGGLRGSWWEKKKVIADEAWMQRQESAFTNWINFVLVNPGGMSLSESGDEPLAITSGTTWRSNVTPRKKRARVDFSSLRVLTVKRLESTWSRSMLAIYRSSDLTQVSTNLLAEIRCGRLSGRQDRPAYADVGLQEELMLLLSNYNPVWLWLGLEAILGSRACATEKCTLRSIIGQAAKSNNRVNRAAQSTSKSPATQSKVLPRSLRRVIVNHLIHDAHIAKNFRIVRNLKAPVGDTGTRSHGNSRITGCDYFDALMNAFVFKFLMLVITIDQAAQQRTEKFSYLPCVFNADTPQKKQLDDNSSSVVGIKSSQRIIGEFCRLVLSKEGRIDKHLKQLGFTVNYEQSPLDEVDLEITNLALDLRDGVRLAKLLETLTVTQDMPERLKPLTSFLRVPASSRLQKVHNVELCLHFLEEKCGREVLEGIRSSCCAQPFRGSFSSLREKHNNKMLEEMAKSIVDGHREKTLALLWKLISVFQLRSLVNTEKLAREIALIRQRLSSRAVHFLENSSPDSFDNDDDDDVQALLLEWCRVVCANYSLPVSDFSSSFADGRALCYLLHYYHPMLLSRQDIQPTTPSISPNGKLSESEISQARNNERRHFTLINERVKQLGDVPVLLPHEYDTSNLPDAKVIVTFISYLQSRLIDSSREIHAAARLKRWWRSPKVRRILHLKKSAAARTIQRLWYSSSVKRLAIWRCRRLLYAARLITASGLCWLWRSRYLRLRQAVTTLQRRYRSKSIVNALQVESATRIQRVWRVCVVIQRDKRNRRANILRSQYCARIIIRAWKSFQHRRKVLVRVRTLLYKLRIKNALANNVKQKREEREALQKYQAMLRAQQLRARRQALWKRVRQRCARCIQEKFREYMVVKRNLSATKIQARWRQTSATQHYWLSRTSLILIQRSIKSWLIMRRLHQLVVRQRHISQERLERLHRLRTRAELRAVRVIQNCWLQFVHDKRFRSAIQIQRYYRGFLGRVMLNERKRQRDEIAGLTLQKFVRMARCRRSYVHLRRSTLKIQAVVRSHQSRRHQFNFYDFKRRATHSARLLAAWKIEMWMATLIEKKTRHTAATAIQKTVRRFLARKHYTCSRRGAIRIQALVRGLLSRRYQHSYYDIKRCLCRLRQHVARWVLRAWAANCIKQRHNKAAITLQSVARMHLLQVRWVKMRRAATLIQSQIRGVRSRAILFDYNKFCQQREVHRLNLAKWKVQNAIMAWAIRLRRLKAAVMVQRNVRKYQCRQQFILTKNAVIRLQSWYRGHYSRNYILNYKSFKSRALHGRNVIACWKVQNWILAVVLRARSKVSAAVAIQKYWKRKVVRRMYCSMRYSTILIQSRWRGFQSRVQHHNHATFRAVVCRIRLTCAAWKLQLWTAARWRKYRDRRHALVTATWVRLSYSLLFSRREAVTRIAKAWQSYRLREAVRALVESRHEHRILVHAVVRVQTAWRLRLHYFHFRRKLCALKASRGLLARRLVGSWLFRRVVLERRRQRTFIRSIRTIQSWWRGMLVRLHQSPPDVTEQRKKLAGMVFIGDEEGRSNNQDQTHHDTSKPLTLGARLEMALHLLLHGKRLQEMLFASHTIEMCTRYSRECAWKCVKLKIANTIFAAIRGLNRSRPHVELLHQLLLVLINLTSYQRKESKNYTATLCEEVDQDDLRAVDALVDLLHVHRDMHVIFVLASRVLKHYLKVLKPFTTDKEVFAQWSEARRRLHGLHELLAKKMQVAAWTGKGTNAAPMGSGVNANVMTKINPKTAVALVNRLLKIVA